MTKLKKETSFSFPRGPMPLAAAADEGVRAIEADYIADVNGIAEEMRVYLESKDSGSGAGQLAKLEGMLDRSPRCKVERKAQLGLLVSQNADVAFEEGYEFEEDEESVPYNDLVWYAMRRDVLDVLNTLGVDTSEIDAAIGDEGEPDDDEDHDVDEDES